MLRGTTRKTKRPREKIRACRDGSLSRNARKRPAKRTSRAASEDRLLQNTDRLLDGLLLGRAHLRALREVLDQHVARSANLGEVVRRGHDLLLVVLEVCLELRERELRGLELGLEAVAGVDEVRPRLLVRGGGGLEVRDLLRLLRLEVLLARGEVLARGLQDLHHVAAALLHVAAGEGRHLRRRVARSRIRNRHLVGLHEGLVAVEVREDIDGLVQGLDRVLVVRELSLEIRLRLLAHVLQLRVLLVRELDGVGSVLDGLLLLRDLGLGLLDLGLELLYKHLVVGLRLRGLAEFVLAPFLVLFLRALLLVQARDELLELADDGRQRLTAPGRHGRRRQELGVHLGGPLAEEEGRLLALPAHRHAREEPLRVHLAANGLVTLQQGGGRVLLVEHRHGHVDCLLLLRAILHALVVHGRRVRLLGLDGRQVLLLVQERRLGRRLRIAVLLKLLRDLRENGLLLVTLGNERVQLRRLLLHERREGGLKLRLLVHRRLLVLGKGRRQPLHLVNNRKRVSSLHFVGGVHRRAPHPRRLARARVLLQEDAERVRRRMLGRLRDDVKLLDSRNQRHPRGARALLRLSVTVELAQKLDGLLACSDRVVEVELLLNVVLVLLRPLLLRGLDLALRLVDLTVQPRNLLREIVLASREVGDDGGELLEARTQHVDARARRLGLLGEPCEKRSVVLLVRCLLRLNLRDEILQHRDNGVKRRHTRPRLH